MSPLKAQDVTGEALAVPPARLRVGNDLTTQEACLRPRRKDSDENSHLST
jgi:hypothetical protein